MSLAFGLSLLPLVPLLLATSSAGPPLRSLAAAAFARLHARAPLDDSASLLRAPSHRSGSLRVLLPLYGVSLACTLAGAAAYAALSPTRRAAGFVAAGAVCAADGVGAVAWRRGLLLSRRSPAPFLVAAGAARACLLLFPPSSWFLGHALLYCVVAGALAAASAAAAYPPPLTPAQARAARLDTALATARNGGGNPAPSEAGAVRAVSVSQTAAEQQQAGAQQPKAALPPAPATAALDAVLLFCGRKVVLYGLLTAAFAGELAYVSRAPPPPVPGLASLHPQWQFGVAALMVPLSAVAALALWRALRRMPPPRQPPPPQKRASTTTTATPTRRIEPRPLPPPLQPQAASASISPSDEEGDGAPSAAAPSSQPAGVVDSSTAAPAEAQTAHAAPSEADAHASAGVYLRHLRCLLAAAPPPGAPAAPPQPPTLTRLRAAFFASPLPAAPVAAACAAIAALASLGIALAFACDCPALLAAGAFAPSALCALYAMWRDIMPVPYPRALAPWARHPRQYTRRQRRLLVAAAVDAACVAASAGLLSAGTLGGSGASSPAALHPSTSPYAAPSYQAMAVGFWAVWAQCAAVGCALLYHTLSFRALGTLLQLSLLLLPLAWAGGSVSLVHSIRAREAGEGVASRHDRSDSAVGVAAGAGAPALLALLCGLLLWRDLAGWSALPSRAAATLISCGLIILFAVSSLVAAALSPLAGAGLLAVCSLAAVAVSLTLLRARRGGSLPQWAARGALAACAACAAIGLVTGVLTARPFRGASVAWLLLCCGLAASAAVRLARAPASVSPVFVVPCFAWDPQLGKAVSLDGPVLAAAAAALGLYIWGAVASAALSPPSAGAAVAVGALAAACCAVAAASHASARADAEAAGGASVDGFRATVNAACASVGLEPPFRGAQTGEQSQAAGAPAAPQNLEQQAVVAPAAPAGAVSVAVGAAAAAEEPRGGGEDASVAAAWRAVLASSRARRLGDARLGGVCSRECAASCATLLSAQADAVAAEARCAAFIAAVSLLLRSTAAAERAAEDAALRVFLASIGVPPSAATEWTEAHRDACRAAHAAWVHGRAAAAAEEARKAEEEEEGRRRRRVAERADDDAAALLKQAEAARAADIAAAEAAEAARRAAADAAAEAAAAAEEARRAAAEAAEADAGDEAARREAAAAGAAAAAAEEAARRALADEDMRLAKQALAEEAARSAADDGIAHCEAVAAALYAAVDASRELFCDEEFPAGPAALYSDGAAPSDGGDPLEVLSWARPAEILAAQQNWAGRRNGGRPPAPALFAPGAPDACRVQQGALGDCWAVSAIAVLCEAGRSAWLLRSLGHARPSFLSRSPSPLPG